MKPISLITAALLFLALATSGGSTTDNGDGVYRFNYENVLGTSLELKFAATSEAQARRAEAAALGEIDREAKILSSWDVDSEFSRWTRTRGMPVRVSPALFEVLGMYDRWRERTDGALDASAEAVIRVWKAAADGGRLPTQAKLDAAVAAVRQAHWRLDAANRTATHLSDTPLVLASFTKSYILSRAAGVAMKTSGVSSAVVNIGGDLVVRGAITEPVAIADPQADAENDPPMAELMIHNRAVATSGGYRRGFEIGGRHYSHIVDPRSGMPAADVISSTVVAPDAAEAGALATAFSVMKPAESQKLAQSIPGVEYLLVRKNGERVASREFRGILRTKSGIPPSNGTWNAAMELTIHVELASPLLGFAKRPYLAAWVEDSNRSAVRTLALWYRKERYLDELRAWYRAQGNDPRPSVSSATRGPGKYAIDWDGKDNRGNYIRAGKYTVFLEVAREHGTYQLMRQELDFNGTPKQISFPANTEVASASFDYHKR
jgi:thiamine biosynthesis lipoprotein